MILPILAAPLLFTPAPLAQDDGQSPPPIQELNGEYILNFAQAESGEEGMTLARLVRACEQVTGITFTYTEETFTFLNSAQVRLIGTKTVPKDEFYNFFQILMVIHDFVCTEVGADPISIIEITSLQTGGRNTIRKDSVFVEPEDLDRYADQPATLITTVVSLPNTDVRQLSNSMRTMITDTKVMHMENMTHTFG